MNDWRLLKLETRNAFMNMAIDEAILKARIAGTVPNTLRFYRWKPSAVSIGRFQRVSDEVYIENCRRHEVDVVRRITGGGAVYHDYEGEITYSVIVGEKDVGSKDVVSAYNRICKGLIEAAKILGINADFNPGDPKKCPNITINERKISGSAQSRKKGVLLQHGTFLLDINLEKMFTLLRVPWAKTCMEVVNVAEKRLTSVRQEVGSGIPIGEVHQALVQGFQRTFKMQPIERELTSYERNLTEKLRREKFATNEWNFKGEISASSWKRVSKKRKG